MSVVRSIAGNHSAHDHRRCLVVFLSAAGLGQLHRSNFIASPVFLTERYRFARRTLQLPIPHDRDRSKSAHAFLVDAVRWHQRSIRAQLTCIPIAYNCLHFSPVRSYVPSLPNLICNGSFRPTTIVAPASCTVSRPDRRQSVQPGHA